MKQTRPFVIWATGFYASGGGSIVLHYLCHLLNNMGHEAYIWPGARWPIHSFGKISENRGIEIAQQVWRIMKNQAKRDIFYLHPSLQTPIARAGDIENAIVVYPEIVDGNPLGCERVVRWLLHKPGYHTGSANFGENDLHFLYQEYFDDEMVTKESKNTLRIRWIRDDIYIRKNFDRRSGSCYMIRKGKDRPGFVKPTQSKRLDYYGHRKTADIFNQKETFYSYDLYTMYCVYAAMCGCIPVVVPRPDVQIQDWRANPEDRYGIAYGESEIDWAIETRSKLIERLYKEKRGEEHTVSSFVQTCYNYFD